MKTPNHPSVAEVVSARVFAAPRAALFRAFTDPEILARWWGPRGFTNTFLEFEPRAGGAWRLEMRGPDGTAYLLAKEFVEVVPAERIVLRHLDPVHGFRMEMTFADEGPGTRVTWRMRFDDAEELERVRSRVQDANEENFERLEEQLAVSFLGVRPGAEP